MTLSLPAGLERFLPLGILGTGGFGKVWLCNDRELGRPVALKLIQPSTPDALERFEREARVTAKLRHSGIVTLYDYGLLPGSAQAWIAYEYIDGPDLASLSRPPRIETVRSWGIHLAEALAAAHQAGILHRDVKPANVLLRGGSSPVLADFGLARTEEPGAFKTQAGIILGTPMYMAPELWRASPPSTASDQYSLAATLFELVTGAPLHPNPDPMEIFRRFEAGVPIDLRSLPSEAAGLRETFQVALAQEAGARYPSLTDFALALRQADLVEGRVATETAQLAQPRQQLPRARPRSSRPPTTQVVSRTGQGNGSRFLVALLLAGVTAGFLISPSPSEPRPSSAVTSTPRVPPEELAWHTVDKQLSALDLPPWDAAIETVEAELLRFNFPPKLRRLFRSLEAWISASDQAESLASPASRARFQKRVRPVLSRIFGWLRQLRLKEQEIYQLRRFSAEGETLADTHRRFRAVLGEYREYQAEFLGSLAPHVSRLPSWWIGYLIRSSGYVLAPAPANLLQATLDQLAKPIEYEDHLFLIETISTYIRFGGGGRFPIEDRRALAAAVAQSVDKVSLATDPAHRSILRVRSFLTAFPLCVESSADVSAADLDLVRGQLAELERGFPAGAADLVAHLARDARSLRSRVFRIPPPEVIDELLPRASALEARALAMGGQPAYSERAP